MQFTGGAINSGAKASDLSIDGASDRTVTCWALAQAFDAGGVWGCGTSGTTRADFSLRTRAAAEILPAGGDNVWTVNRWVDDMSVTIASSKNNWIFLTVTHDTSGTDTSELFAAVLDVDSLVTSRVSNAAILVTGDEVTFRIGEFAVHNNDPFTPVHFNGYVSDVRVYDRVLSLAELQTIFAGKGRIKIVRGLQGHWPLRDGLIGAEPDSFFIDVATNQVGGAGATSLSVNVPTHVDGDLLVAVIVCGGDSTGTPAVLTIPGTWTHVNTSQTDLPSTVSTPSVWIMRRTASSEPASYSFSQDETCMMSGAILSYRNTATTEDSSSAISTGTSALPLAPSVTTTNPVLCMRVWVNDDDDSQRIDDGPTSRVDIEQAGNDGSGGNGATLVIADGVRQTTPTNSAGSTIDVSDEQWGP